MTELPLLVAVMGPTASGKSALAERLGDHLNFPLINADAFQVYRGLDIGTAKPSDRSNYHLLDLIEPWAEYGAGAWIRDVLAILGELFATSGGAIVVGGSGYYIRALFEEYQDLAEATDAARRAELGLRTHESLVEELRQRAPDVADRTDLNNRVRVQRAIERLELPRLEWQLPPCRTLKLARVPDLAANRTRIFDRVVEMVRDGWMDEVGALAERGVQRDHPGMRAHGYRAMWDVIHGDRLLEEAIEATQVEVIQYAKRQRTWLRAEPRLITITEQDEGIALTRALDLLWSQDGKINQSSGHVLESGA